MFTIENTSWIILEKRDDYHNINILLTHISPPKILSSQYFAEGKLADKERERLLPPFIPAPLAAVGMVIWFLNICKHELKK